MKPRILVTGVGGRSVGAGVLHSLMRTAPAVRDRWETVATDSDPFSWGLYVADHAVLVPAVSASGYLEWILDLIEAHQIAAVIPGTETETSLLASRRDEIPVPVIANEAGLMPLMMDKAQAEAKLRELGLPFIPSYSWEQREQAVSEFGFPAFVKPTVGTGGSRGVHLVTSPAELDALVPSVRADSRSIVQPYLGDGDAEYTVGVLSDHSGSLIDSIVIRRKLVGLSLLDVKTFAGRTATVSTGISQGFIERHPEIQEFCEDIAARLGSRGPLNLQLRIHDGEFYVFEIHPRFSGNDADSCLRGLQRARHPAARCPVRKRFGRLEYAANVAAIRAFEHVLVPVDEMIGAGSGSRTCWSPRSATPTPTPTRWRPSCATSSAPARRSSGSPATPSAITHGRRRPSRCSSRRSAWPCSATTTAGWRSWHSRRQGSQARSPSRTPASCASSVPTQSTGCGRCRRSSGTSARAGGSR